MLVHQIFLGCCVWQTDPVDSAGRPLGRNVARGTWPVGQHWYLMLADTQTGRFRLFLLGIEDGSVVLVMLF